MESLLVDGAKCGGSGGSWSEWYGVVDEEVVAEVKYVGFGDGVWGIAFGGRRWW